MDKQSLSHQLTDEERVDFEAQGYLIIRNALPKDMVSRAKAALDRVEAKHRKQHGLTPDEHMNHLDAIGEDDVLYTVLCQLIYVW